MALGWVKIVGKKKKKKSKTREEIVRQNAEFHS